MDKAEPLCDLTIREGGIWARQARRPVVGESFRPLAGGPTTFVVKNDEQFAAELDVSSGTHPGPGDPGKEGEEKP